MRLTARMSVAAHPLPVDRQCYWVEELSEILGRWDSLSDAARVAVLEVARSILDDPTTPRVEVTRARALLDRETGTDSRHHERAKQRGALATVGIADVVERAFAC